MTAPSTGSTWKAVVQQLAERTGHDPVALPPISDTVDPEALDRLVQTGADGDGTFSIQFSYAGHQIEVDSDGAIRCTPVAQNQV